MNPFNIFFTAVVASQSIFPTGNTPLEVSFKDNVLSEIKFDDFTCKGRFHLLLLMPHTGDLPSVYPVHRMDRLSNILHLPEKVLQLIWQSFVDRKKINSIPLLSILNLLKPVDFKSLSNDACQVTDRCLAILSKEDLNSQDELARGVLKCAEILFLKFKYSKVLPQQFQKCFVGVDWKMMKILAEEIINGLIQCEQSPDPKKDPNKNCLDTVLEDKKVVAAIPGIISNCTITDPTNGKNQISINDLKGLFSSQENNVLIPPEVEKTLDEASFFVMGFPGNKSEELKGNKVVEILGSNTATSEQKFYFSPPDVAKNEEFKVNVYGFGKCDGKIFSKQVKITVTNSSISSSAGYAIIAVVSLMSTLF
ncbi:hypothetical protein DSO57_1002749 [Entomophthora muscae]|uniref:Uncharacterized protein n=1 Tax=Entomophthora muscae TaxID=34485 RepID=A0ACC2UTT0_9FUNG|nr:hypothetical protein DSO57_1002749 [Entomophthora muscae]